MDAQELKATLLDLKSRLEDIKVNVFQIEDKKKRLEEIENELSQEKVWSDLELSQKLSKEKTNLQKIISKYQTVDQKVSDSEVLIDISIEEKDDSAIKEVNQEVLEIYELIEDFEFSRMFNKKMDGSSAFIEIQAGSGGTEAQDWAEMLMRMYSKWAESRGFNIKVVEISHGDVAGIKSASIYVDGDHAYGWLRTETGIHRLVRKSPFDSGNRRHTSFASVFISPEVDDSIEININKADIRTACDLIRRDSVHGKFRAKISIEKNKLIINGNKITYSQETNLNSISWKKYNVDIVLECTGKFNSKDKLISHIKNGAKKVIVSAPCKNADKTIVYELTIRIF